MKTSDMQIRPKSNITTSLISVVALVMLLTLADQAPKYIQGFNNINSTKDLYLGNPFVVENYQSEGGKPETMNKTINSNFTGEGILNGTINITVEGNFSEILRNNDTSYLQGKTKFSTDDDSAAVFNFYAIGNYNPDGTFNSNGAAIFEDKAKGELSFLSNVVAIYKDQVSKNGSGTFLMWQVG